MRNGSRPRLGREPDSSPTRKFTTSVRASGSCAEGLSESRLRGAGTGQLRAEQERWFRSPVQRPSSPGTAPTAVNQRVRIVDSLATWSK